MIPLTRTEARRREMVALAPAIHGPAPGRYDAIARWWLLHAEESANPSGPNRYAANMKRLAADMRERPGHYAAKPLGMTDYLWSQK